MDSSKKESSIHVLWLPIILALGILYVLSPVDTVPDIFPIFGRLDDLAVALALVWFFTSWLPKNRHRLYWFRPHPTAGSNGDGSCDEQTARHSKTVFNPFHVLNVERGASPDEIRHAYREMLSKYHPDKVAHLGQEFQQMAHVKVIEITKAYEMLCGKG
jgi:hypothetical protein